MSEKARFQLKEAGSRDASVRSSTFKDQLPSSRWVRETRFSPITLRSSSSWTSANVICGKSPFTQSGKFAHPQTLRQEENPGDDVTYWSVTQLAS